MSEELTGKNNEMILENQLFGETAEEEDVFAAEKEMLLGGEADPVPEETQDAQQAEPAQEDQLSVAQISPEDSGYGTGTQEKSVQEEIPAAEEAEVRKESAEESADIPEEEALLPQEETAAEMQEE